MIEKVGVIGGGLMGSGIAEVCARAGIDTVVVEVSEEAAKAAEAKVRGSLERAAARGKITEQDLGETCARIAFATDLGQLKDRDLVVEAASEREDIKLDLF
ncbi:3-hydroxyacyl-CoA dehydrogenase NAD-binding domain-containing protein, partial [Nocardioides sp. AN3]